MHNGPYELVLAPPEYPGKKYRERYVYEHQLVWWQTTGKLVPAGKVIHHRNENRRDNRFKNLELKTSARHTSDHHAPVTMVKLRCAHCSVTFTREARNVHTKARGGQRRFFCCRSHAVSAQQLERWNEGA